MGLHKRIYNSARWQKLRARKLRETPLCEYCPSEHRAVATEVDHFKAISDGGDAYDMENLKSSCKSCHSQKTAQRERLTGCDAKGMPRDPSHGWNS